MEDCLFCMIAEGKIPSKKLYEDEQVVAFYDINPQAKVHFLVVPKKHIPSAAALTEEDGALLGHIFAVIGKLAKEQGLDNGYRVIYTRKTDSGISLAGRTAKANENQSDLFVSIHVNSHPSPSVAGFETYYLDRTAALDAAKVVDPSDNSGCFHVQNILSRGGGRIAHSGPRPPRGFSALAERRVAPAVPPRRTIAAWWGTWLLFEKATGIIPCAHILSGMVPNSAYPAV